MATAVRALNLVRPVDHGHGMEALSGQAEFAPQPGCAHDAPGFVWRLKDESEEAAATRLFGDDHVVNMSVWKDVESLRRYAFEPGHVEFMRRLREWFHPMTEAHAGLWWVAAGQRPSALEVRQKLDHLRSHGAGPLAFTFQRSYLPPDPQRPVSAGAARCRDR